MATLKYVQNDTAPNITFNVTRQGVGVVDLTGATVNFRIQDTSSNTITNAAHTACTITNATAGTCLYTLQSGDLPDATTYSCDLVITWPSGKEETYPKSIVIVARAEV